MVIIQARSNRKPSGGRYKSTLSKRTHMLGRPSAVTKIGDLRVKKVSVKGGNTKMRVLESAIANVFDPKAKKYEKATIKLVASSPANRNFVRRNILTKGAVIDTSKGKAVITSRPGQDGTINAVLVE